MRPIHLSAVVLASVLALGRCGWPRENAPRVVGPHNADAYSARTFAQFPRWKDLSGDAKVYEIYKYLTDKRTGVYPLGLPATEGDEAYEYSVVRDPIKMLNVHPAMYCDQIGPSLAGLLQDMGIGPARTADLPPWHTTLEVFHDGKWHFLDFDGRLVFRRADGSLASLQEAREDEAVWPRDRVAERGKWVRTKPAYRHNVNMSGHTMDYVLRRGETFTRWWQPQGGRFHYCGFAQNKHLMGIVDREPRGIKCKHDGWTIHTQGNGRFIYQPNLTDKSADFADGVYDFSNVRPGQEGLRLEKEGEGFAVFEVRTPYLIVPIVGKAETKEDDKEASVVEVNAAGVGISLSLDNGLTWRDVETAPGPTDLTKHVSGTYGYLLKLALKGRPDEAIVRGLKVTTWVQVHPASLPALRQGRNEMKYVTGDHYGMQTRVLEISSKASKPEEFLKYLSEPPKAYEPGSRTARAKGPLVARLPALPGTKIAWFCAGAALNTIQGAGAKDTRNTIAFSANEPQDFKEIYRADIPPWQSHWHYNGYAEVKLEAPADVVFVKYVGDPAVNNIHLYAHCLDAGDRLKGLGRPGPADVKIVHAWKENGQLKTKGVTVRGPSATYEVTADAEPSDEYIEMSVTSETAK